MMTVLSPLQPNHFDSVIALGNHVHGDNYLSTTSLSDLYERSWQNNINASWVALDRHGKLVGFRLTIAPQNWSLDKWCTPQKWPVDKETVCYFKCNTVDASERGKGIGSRLLKQSISSVKQQGAKAGLAHIWLASPNNSAYRYFYAAGGRIVKRHPNKWQKASIEDDYLCPICGSLCECEAAEMLLHFNQ